MQHWLGDAEMIGRVVRNGGVITEMEKGQQKSASPHKLPIHLLIFVADEENTPLCVFYNFSSTP
jgi:hypothetical protein